MNPDEDEDVQEEREKVKDLKSQDISNHQLVLRDVTKYYKNFLAVQRLSIAVKGFECFGLLGINGAGKTSTFQMLTGDEKISYGDAWVNGLSLKSSMNEVNKRIGYCPQFDALLDDLTMAETIKIFCLLRGIRCKDIRYINETLANEFGFKRHLNKKVRALSGGNKRKLSTAIALIGDPNVIYLDEPSTGMDPLAKRYIWQVINRIRDSGKCIVLTSHSMEECEALCTRIAIMVNGNFMCLGSIQRLKSRFSEGYTLNIKVKKDMALVNQSDILIVDEFVSEKFSGAVLHEQHNELLTYYIANIQMPWSQMFGIMEDGKKKLPIQDYSLGQSTLEMVFLKFTKYQRENLHLS